MVEIPRRKEASKRPVISERENGDLRIWDGEAARGITGLEALQYSMTNGPDNTLPH